MVTYENFIVEVPMCSGFSVGEVVESNIRITLRRDVVLNKGLVVKVDTDQGQELLPLFFVTGLTTRVRSALRLESLDRSNTGRTWFNSQQNVDFLDSFEPALANAYKMLLCWNQTDQIPEDVHRNDKKEDP